VARLSEREADDVKATTLADVPAGFSGRIRDVVGDHATCVHLMETGFTPGQAVRLVAVSPLGDPLAFALRGTVIALRRHEARCILV
jgi:ferrous iron transport protein A